MTKEIYELRDKPGYEISHGARLIRVTPRTPGISVQRLYESGYQPGKWRKAMAISGRRI